MTASVGDVAAQLRRAIESLHSGAASALRAEREAGTGLGALSHAATGSRNPAVRAAVDTTRTVTQKCARLARLLSIAADELDAYVQEIVHGGLAGGAAITPPSGSHLVRSIHRHGPLGRRLLRGIHDTPNADDGLTNLVATGNELERGVPNQGGVASDRQPDRPASQSPERFGSGDIFLGALVLAAVGLRAAETIASLRARKTKDPQGPGGLTPYGPEHPGGQGAALPGLELVPGTTEGPRAPG